MQYKVLVVEDDRGIAEAIAVALQGWDMQAKAVGDLRNVLSEFEVYAPHLVLMDISLPFMDGYHWCREIRKQSSVPIIFISSAADNMNIIMAMNMGGDDFIAKPFDKAVLIAKIQALLRRSYDFVSPPKALSYRGLVLNTGDFSFAYNGGKVNLTKNEYKILLTLLENKGSIVSREKLMEALWETDCFVDENTLSVNVGRVRRKLDGAGLHDCIVTKFGVGYLLRDPG